MYAVVKTGGKQYRVTPNDLISVEKLSGSPGDVVELGQVLLIAGDAGIEVGSPLVAGATVAAEIVSHVRGDRIIIFKKRRRHHYRRRNGHRQDLTQVRITEILTGGARPAKKAAAPPVEAASPPVEAVPVEQPAESAAPATAKPKAEAKSKPAAKAKAAAPARAAKKPAPKKK